MADVTVKWTDKTGPKPIDKQGVVQSYIVVGTAVNAVVVTKYAIEVVPVSQLSFP